MTDVVGSVAAAETNGGPGLGFSTASAPGTVTFGATSDLPAATVLSLTPSASATYRMTNAAKLPAGTYDPATVGSYGFWVEVTNTATVAFTVFAGGGTWFVVGVGNSVSLAAGGSAGLAGPAVVQGHPYYIQVTSASSFAAGAWTLVFTLWVNGVSYGTSTYSATTLSTLTNSQRSPVTVQVDVSDAGAGTSTTYISRLSHTQMSMDESGGFNSTAQARLAAVAITTPEITLDTVPTMSPAILGTQGGNTTLAMMDEVLRGEQGGMKVITTGTLLAPVPKIVTYARDRKRAVDLTVSMNQIQDKPTFLRALTNTVAYATADGPTESVTYFDPTMPALVGSANTSDQVTLRDHNDLYASASDRLYRGKNVLTPILSFTIDARSLDVNLWTQLMALRPGHRVHITDCLQLNFGYPTWDGWAVGCDELHTGETKSLFTIYVQPAWDVPVYGTARYAAGAGVMTLQSTITSSSTSIGIVSTGDLYTTNVSHFPQNITIGNEIVTLSGVTGTSSPQTGTISARGVGVVPAKAWTAGAAIDVSPLWRYDY